MYQQEYLTRMGIDYIDTVQVHASYVSKIPLVETYGAINELIKNDCLYKVVKENDENKLELF